MEKKLSPPLPWPVSVVTLIPELFPGPLGYSITGRALARNLWQLSTFNIRDFATNSYGTVDDTPYGGGVGMILKPDVVHSALEAAYTTHTAYAPTPRIIFPSPRGIPLTQSSVAELAANPSGLIILCGRYEGVDQRVIEHWTSEFNLLEVSVGDYILTGGELAALSILDACIRLLPGTLKKKEATTIESFTKNLLEYSQYTRPELWNNYPVPSVLLSGHHEKILNWRADNARLITKERRPDLLVGKINQ